MLERISGIAPIAGSLTLFVADGRAASRWCGNATPEPIEAFHAACEAGEPACAPVAIERGASGHEAIGWLAQLGAMPLDATVFQTADDAFVVVGPYWERPDDEDFDAAKAELVRRLALEPAGERRGTLQVPSGRLLLADAWSDLTGIVREASAIVPEEQRADLRRYLLEKAERRAKIIANVDRFREGLRTLPEGDRSAVIKLIESSLENSAEGACAHIELFGGSKAVVRRDTGDLMLVVPAGSYALTVREAQVQDERVGILKLERE